MTIGKGVLGSRNETKSRQKVDWKEGTAWLLRENGGTALGWMHSKNAEEDTAGHAVMYSIKIPLQKIDEKEEKNGNSPDWVQTVIEICRQNLAETKDKNDENKETVMQDSSVQLSKDESSCLKKLIDSLLLENQKDD